MQSPSAVLFDLDDTLMADDAATEEAFQVTCARAQKRHGLDPSTLARAVRREARRLWQEAPTGVYCRAVGISSTEGLRANFSGDDPNLARLRAWAPEYRGQAWSGGLAELDVRDDGLVEELAAVFAAERGVRHWVFPDVIPMLTWLRESYRLALVTNGAADLQRAKIGSTDLASYFDAIIVSAEIGIGKPDPRPFALALATLAVDPDRAVMIGDSPERDLVGAQNAGIRGIWIDRCDSGAGTAEHARIVDLRQLPPLL